jgi:pyruvate/oxaloacetate carboxyltransferase
MMDKHIVAILKGAEVAEYFIKALENLGFLTFRSFQSFENVQNVNQIIHAIKNHVRRNPEKI